MTFADSLHLTNILFLLWFPTCYSGSKHSNMDPSYVQHLIRKLGNEPYIGQRAILSASQTLSVLAESLLFTDPFDAAFPRKNECMFIM